MLADCYADLYADWSMVKDCAGVYDQKQVGLSDSEIIMKASAAKLFCTEMVGRVADKGVQIHGGAGYMSDYKVERFYRDVRLLR
jgi:acyl-CoA dehydrogenase